MICWHRVADERHCVLAGRHGGFDAGY